MLFFIFHPFNINNIIPPKAICNLGWSQIWLRCDEIQNIKNEEQFYWLPLNHSNKKKQIEAIERKKTSDAENTIALKIRAERNNWLTFFLLYSL